MRSASERCAIESTARRGRPSGGAEQAPDVERIALEPRLERRRREEVVELAGEREAILRREERLELERADAREGRLLERADQARQVELRAALPGLADDAREQDVLAAPERIGVAAEEREQPRDRGLRALAERVGVGRRAAGGGAAKERSGESGRPARLPGV